MRRPVQARSIKTVEVILAAAESLIAREGLKSFTIEAVAVEAGVSKGAVLHHFREKDAMIAAMVGRQLATLRAGRQAEEDRLYGQPSRALRAMIRQSARQFADKAGFPPALMLAAIENSRCLDEVGALGDETLKHIKAGSMAPDEATVLCFAALGLLLSRAVGFVRLESEDGAELFRTIERMALRLE